MGVDISVGDSGSENYVSESLGSYTSFLSWKNGIAEQEGVDFFKGYNGKFKLALIRQGDYKVEELPGLLQELYQIKKLNIKEYDTIVCFDTEEVDPVIDKFIRICEIAIERKLPIRVN